MHITWLMLGASCQQAEIEPDFLVVKGGKEPVEESERGCALGGNNGSQLSRGVKLWGKRMGIQYILTSYLSNVNFTNKES